LIHELDDCPKLPAAQKNQHSPDSISGQCAAGQKHPNIPGCSLNNRANGNNNTHHLHEADPPELVADQSLGHRTHGFAGDIDCNDLSWSAMSAQERHGRRKTK
jgi:hypothetical protein